MTLTARSTNTIRSRASYEWRLRGNKADDIQLYYVLLRSREQASTFLEVVSEVAERDSRTPYDQDEANCEPPR